MIFQVESFGERNPGVTNMRCPNCQQMGSFEWPGNVKDVLISGKPPIIVGHRRCPNPDCHTHVFAVFEGSSRELLVSYPAERIDFDASNVPSEIVSTLEEAITCHASQCYTASAIMIRKTLEVMCSIENAEGPNLSKRIKALGTQIVLPVELLEGLDDLRLLGNDAAHIESRVFDQIGQEEVEVALEFTKEVLKAKYQYQELLDRLRRLQNQS